MTATGSFQVDYEVLVGAVGFVDRSERGKLALSGADAREFLHGQVTNDIRALKAGSGCYAAFLTQKGKMLGDLRVLSTGDELLIDTERPALQDLFNMIRRYSLGYDTELHKRTLESGLLSLIGPHSAATLTAVADRDSPQLSEVEHDHLLLQIADTQVRAVRTDLGVDLIMNSDQLGAVRAVLVSAGAAPVSEDAAEALRIETGRPRYAVDLDDSVIPQEAALNDRAVSFTKGCYVGQETVARLFYRGKPNRELRGLRSDQLLAPGTELSHNGRLVATVTSSTNSPRYGAIALALVRKEAPIGSRVQAGEDGDAEVVALPFS